MSRKHFRRFLKDEEGGYTIWGLTWFILYVGIGGLAVDITDAFRTQSMLQTPADSAALAGISSPLSNEAEVDDYAISYAAANMRDATHGEVLTAAEVQIGTWNFTTRTFSGGGSNPNAVRAVTRRDTNNSNPLATNFLRIIGLDTWNVSTEAVAAKGIDWCLNNGIIAGGALDVKTHIHFYGEICLIGHEKFWFRNNDTTFEDGVYIGAGCFEEDKKCIGPGNQANKNEDFLEAFDMANGGNYEDPIMPTNAENVGKYIEIVKKIPTYKNFNDFLYNMSNEDSFVDYSGYNYLADGNGQTDLQPVTTLPSTRVEYTVYNLDCPNSGYVLPQGDYNHVAVIADCPISFVTDGIYNFNNSLLASTFSSSGRMSIKGSAKVNLGTAGCDGGNEMYSLGDVDFASDGQFANLRILVDGDIHFAASSDSPSGTNIEATGDVFLASGSAATSQYGLCANGPKPGAQALSIALVH
jgi:Flp pilus assembly protein TadG